LGNIVSSDQFSAAFRAQADALEIEALAKRRLADEYDAAQERGEVAVQGKPSKAKGLATASQIGLSYKEIHEARTIRDADTRPRATAQSLGEGDDHIFALTPHNVTGVRLAIGTDQQDKLIRNVGTRRDFDGGTGCSHISNCATDLSIREDDLTGLKTPNRGSAFMHGVCQSSAIVHQNYLTNRCDKTVLVGRVPCISPCWR
jgi:hypothetical protein